MHELRFAVRRLWKQPSFTAIAALTLALGIGGTTAVFSVVNGVLIKPLPYPDPDALVGIWHIAPGANVGGDVNMSAPQLFTYREENRSFQEIGLWSSELGTLSGLGEPEEIRRLTVAYGTLQALGVQPFLGRWFSQQDDTAASPGTIMLTHDYWQRRFGADASVIGRFMTVDAQQRQVIGVRLMIRTFLALRAVHPGFTQPENVQLVRIRIPSAQIPDPQQLFRRQTEIRDRIAAIGGVSAASFAASVPMDGQRSSNILLTEDRTYAEGQLPPVRDNKFVAPGFFATVGISIVAGRDLTWADVYDRRPTAVISENLAREMWREPSEALGKRIRVHPDDPWREIVGVVRDVYDDGVHEQPPATAYFPPLMENFGSSRVFVQRSVTFAIRSTRAGTDSFLNEIRTAVSAVAPDVPLAQIRTLQDVYDRSMARTSFTLVMLAIAGAMALLLGVIGVYGVISYAVAQRTREIGIRTALGAPQRELKGMFVRYAVVLAATGIAVGIAGAIALTRLITSLLFGVSPLDPVTYGAVSLVLMTAAMAASYLPARRAAHVDPLVALRYE